jgi:hypothetical protein
LSKKQKSLSSSSFSETILKQFHLFHLPLYVVATVSTTANIIRPNGGFLPPLFCYTAAAFFLPLHTALPSHRDPLNRSTSYNSLSLFPYSMLLLRLFIIVILYLLFFFPVQF